MEAEKSAQWQEWNDGKKVGQVTLCPLPASDMKGSKMERDHLGRAWPSQVCRASLRVRHAPAKTTPRGVPGIFVQLIVG